LQAAGFRICRFSYRSVADDLDENAARLAAFIADMPGDELHLVGHSLGGIVILRMLERYPQAIGGRVVCLGSPLRGSVAGQALAAYPGGSNLLGKSIASFAAARPVARWSGTQELGLIAGDAPLGLGQFISSLPSPHDGTVAVEETQLEGATEHTVLPVSHLSMLWSGVVAAQIVSFLNSGRFQPVGTSS
jgi:pimeloyl-ACP methyl ester carboxylesterase